MQKMTTGNKAVRFPRLAGRFSQPYGAVAALRATTAAGAALNLHAPMGGRAAAGLAGIPLAGMVLFLADKPMLPDPQWRRCWE